MSLADLNTLYAAAASALDSGDYDTAIAKAMAIKLRLATTPNLTRALAGGGSQGMSFNPAELDSFIQQCRQLKAEAAHATAGPFRTTAIQYQRPGVVEDFT
jgi:hypothetical protein